MFLPKTISLEIIVELVFKIVPIVFTDGDAGKAFVLGERKFLKSAARNVRDDIAAFKLKLTADAIDISLAVAELL